MKLVTATIISSSDTVSVVVVKKQLSLQWDRLSSFTGLRCLMNGESVQLLIHRPASGMGWGHC